MTLIVKDRVKLITDRHGDNRYNPIWMGSQGIVRGTVVEVSQYTITVEWDNGIRNSGYAPDDLKVVQKHRVRPVRGVKYIKICPHCNKDIEGVEGKHNIGNEIVCENCYHKLYQTCFECEQIILQEVGFTNEEGAFYCGDCYAKLYTTCDECEIDILRTEAVEHNGDLYCNDCFCKKFFECKGCSEITPRNRTYSFGMQLYCEECYCERFTDCAECGEAIPRDEAYISNDELYCEHCYENLQNKTIYEHDYKPEPIFNKQKWENTAYLGIELEIETEEGKDDLAERFINKFGANDFCYLKEDGSLTNGFEIVTHPHTLQKHKDRKWREILRWLQEQGADSYDNADCGLHVHVNKDLLSKLEWHKVAVFFYKCQSNIANFSKRTEGQIREFAKFCPPMTLYKAKNMEYETYEDRYEALNWENEDTVEFRIYRGTLNWKRFWASLNFTASLLDYIRETGLAHFTTKDGSELWKHFTEWTKKDYQFLYKYLKGVK